MEAPTREMPRYRCHKIVHALKIETTKSLLHEDNKWTHWIVPADKGYGSIEVSAEFVEKHKPQNGGYYVVYDDGYKSFSPAAAFEAGYTLLDAGHQARVVAELGELRQRLDRLLGFTRTGTFERLDVDERARMVRQANAMQLYAEVLCERIAAFPEQGR